MELLSMSHGEVRLYCSSRLKDSSQVDKITVFAFILRHDTTGPSILLLKQNPDNKYCPGLFEIPGGQMDATDLTVRDAIVRKVAEDTRLTVLDVTALLHFRAYYTEKPEKMTGGDEEVVRHRVLRLSYLVTVQGTDFQVKEEQHSGGTWATGDNMTGIHIVPEMSALATRALGLEDDRIDLCNGCKLCEWIKNCR